MPALGTGGNNLSRGSAVGAVCRTLIEDFEEGLAGVDLKQGR